MATKKEHIEHLQSIALFATLSKKDVAAIAKACDELSFPAGHTLLTEGETGSEAFVVLSGSVAVKRNGRKIAELGPGEIVGELAVLEHHAERTATVVCVTDCSALVIDRRHFSGLLQTTPALAIKFLQELAGRLRALDRAAFG